MQVEQSLWTEDEGWRKLSAPGLDGDPQLVLAFGSRSALERGRVLETLQDAYPQARIMGGSTSGEILGTRVRDGSVAATAVRFEHTRVRAVRVDLSAGVSSLDAGRAVARQLSGPDLAHVLVLSDGLHVNGSDLVAGVVSELPDGVTATGGLAGDGERFQETLLVWGAAARPGAVLAVGLYGDRLLVGYGSHGGWDPFGPDRVITRSEGNVLYELDGRSALELYKRYLGEHAEGLPATGLLFPLALRLRNRDRPVVRTILAVDEEQQSLTFAGDVPRGALARLMRANFDRLIDGAAHAARITAEPLEGTPTELAVLISCVGRRMVLRQRVEEEVEAVRDVLGPGACFTGFYSYGEISPFLHRGACALHNQTMTVTTFSERLAG